MNRDKFVGSSKRMDQLVRASVAESAPVVADMAVTANALDLLAYKSFRKGRRFKNTEVASAEVATRKVCGDKHPFDVFLAEAWMSLYGGRAELSNTQQPYEWDGVHRKVLADVFETPEFKSLQQCTAGDSVMTSVAVETMAQALSQAYLEAVPEEDKQEQQEGGDQEQGGGPPQQSLAQAVEAAQEKCEEAQQRLASCGSEPPEDREIDPTDYMAVADALASDADLVKIMEQVGRALGSASRMMAHDVNATAGHGANFTHGSDIARLADYLFADLSHAVLKNQLLADLVSENAILVSEESYTKDRKGPIVILVDESGSMSGRQLIDAKAVAIATHVIAKREGRSTHFVSFSSVTRVYNPEIPQELLNFMRSNIGGGTCFVHALNDGMDCIDQHKEFGADLLLITDGDSSAHSVVDRIKEQQAKNGLQLFVTLIVTQTEAANEAMCEDVLKHADLKDVVTAYAAVGAGRLVEDAGKAMWRSMEGKSL